MICEDIPTCNEYYDYQNYHYEDGLSFSKNSSENKIKVEDINITVVELDDLKCESDNNCDKMLLKEEIKEEDIDINEIKQDESDDEDFKYDVDLTAGMFSDMQTILLKAKDEPVDTEDFYYSPDSPLDLSTKPIEIDHCSLPKSDKTDLSSHQIMCIKTNNNYNSIDKTNMPELIPSFSNQNLNVCISGTSSSSPKSVNPTASQLLFNTQYIKHQNQGISIPSLAVSSYQLQNGSFIKTVHGPVSTISTHSFTSNRANQVSIQHLLPQQQKLQPILPRSILRQVLPKQPPILKFQPFFLQDKRTRRSSLDYHCHICKQVFSSYFLYLEHRHAHSTRDNAVTQTTWPFSCSMCQQGFLSLNRLRAHLSGIHGHKSFKCSVCNKGFSSTTTLTEHTKIHSGVRQFVCKVCKKSFYKAFNLWRHEIIHTDERPFKCTYCSMDYRDPSSLTKHVKRLHLVPPKSFGKSKNVDQRVKVAHPPIAKIPEKTASVPTMMAPVIPTYTRSSEISSSSTSFYLYQRRKRQERLELQQRTALSIKKE